jgi:predicted RNA-binding Zn-ribbon protein involved in translation (DUF1610 family)
MEKRKLTKEDIDKVRDIEGFPIGTDEDIIALSDAPYYTACPNPFIKEFIEKNGTPYEEETDDYHCEPFAADVSEGKNDPIYNLHSYLTKVPHRAIMRYILHYTKPGDVVFDGFCGTGMTGVAAQLCKNPQNDFKLLIENEEPEVRWGERYAVVSDLSPAATFIAANYNIHLNNRQDFIKNATNILEDCRKEYGWMFKTKHDSNTPSFFGDGMGEINYVIWSDIFLCPSCGKEFVFWDLSVDQKNKKTRDVLTCPHCGMKFKKKDCEHAKKIYFDEGIGKTITEAKQSPVLINYSYGGKRYDKIPDQEDLNLLEKIERLQIPYDYPKYELPEGYNTEQPKRSHGFCYVHQFFTKRNLIVLSYIFDRANELPQDEKLALHAAIKSSFSYGTKMVKVNVSRMLNGGGLFALGAVTGTMYIPSNSAERPLIDAIENKVNNIAKTDPLYSSKNGVIVSTGSLTDMKNIEDDCIDYIFTDPPFGKNLNYSELNYIWEAWEKVFTNNADEAIMNPVQSKELIDYQSLMTKSFTECFRILKPNRWMTVEFHNSQNSVWNAIQEALMRAGFIIADVRTLDKQRGSFKQETTFSAVKQDLVLSVYKPKDEVRRTLIDHAGTEETAWAFVRQHLANLPVVVDADHDGKIDIISERQAYLLFDRMVAYHIMNGIPVPIDATDFYKGLDEKFLKRDGMYFLPDQVNEYDIARIKMDVEPIQFELFVSNEKSAIAWLYQQLDTPQTYAELQPKFMQEVKSVDRYEDMPELSVMLDENFIQDDKGRWYIPDRTKEGDVAKLREKNLWKEFESYMNSKGKLKLFRSEAIRVGFSRLWKDKNYQAIVDMAERLPEQTIQEDDKLLMYYDISLSRVQ